MQVSYIVYLGFLGLHHDLQGTKLRSAAVSQASSPGSARICLGMLGNGDGNSGIGNVTPAN
jgi:hypothetical protein